jgi:hypothetical protein
MSRLAINQETNGATPSRMMGIVIKSQTKKTEILK